MRNYRAVVHGQNQPFLYITDPQNTRAKIGGRARLHCQLAWKDALGNIWNGFIPPIQIQWIINGFGYHIDSLEADFHRRLTVDRNPIDGRPNLKCNKC